MTLDEYRRLHATHLLMEKLAFNPIPAVRAAVQNPLGQTARAVVGAPFTALKKGVKMMAVGSPKMTGQVAGWRRATGQAPTSLRVVGKSTKEKSWKAIPKEQYEKGLAQSTAKAEGSLPASFYRPGQGATEGTYYQRRLTRGGLMGFAQKHPMLTTTGVLGGLILPGQVRQQYAQSMAGVPVARPTAYYSQGTY